MIFTFSFCYVIHQYEYQSTEHCYRKLLLLNDVFWMNTRYVAAKLCCFAITGFWFLNSPIIFSIFWILSRDVYSEKSNFFSKNWAFYEKLADHIMSLDKKRGKNPIKVQRGPKMETRFGLGTPKHLFVWHYWWTWIFSSIFRYYFELSSFSCFQKLWLRVGFFWDWWTI